MTWLDLRSEVADEFGEAQQPVLQQLRGAHWAASAWREHGQEARRKQRVLVSLRQRLRSHPVVHCKNPRCGVEFVPAHANTRYCTARCRDRWNLQEERRRKPPARHQAELQLRRQREAQEPADKRQARLAKRRQKYTALPQAQKQARTVRELARRRALRGVKAGAP